MARRKNTQQHKTGEPFHHDNTEVFESTSFPRFRGSWHFLVFVFNSLSVSRWIPTCDGDYGDADVYAGCHIQSVKSNLNIEINYDLIINTCDADLQMAFVWSSSLTLWFSSWSTRGPWSYCATLVVLFVLGLLQERLHAHRQQSWLRQGQRQCVPLSSRHKCIVPCGSAPPLAARLRWYLPRSERERVLDSMLYALHLSLSYLIMLAVMSFNGGVFLTVVISLAFGRYLCSMQPILPSGGRGTTAAYGLVDGHDGSTDGHNERTGRGDGGAEWRSRSGGGVHGVAVAAGSAATTSDACCPTSGGPSVIIVPSYRETTGGD